MLDAGRVGDAEVGATFTAATAMLAVSVAGPGAAGGSVAVDFADGSPQGAASHGDAFSTPTAVTALAGTTLTATADPGYAFSGWAPAGGLSCEAGTDDNVCVLEVDLAAAAAGSPSAEAAFGLVATTLTVSAGANGSVAAIVRGAAADPVGAGASEEYAFDVESSATLTAEPADGYALSGWALSPGGLSCADEEPVCMVPVQTAGPVAATATFTAATAMLAVSVAGPGAAGGSVAVDFADGSPQGAASHGDAFSTPTAVTELAGTTLTATADPGYAFSGWAPAGGLSCEAGTDDNVCVLEVDLAAAAAGSPSAEAAFGLVATTLTVSAVGDGGRVTAIVRGAAADPVGAGASEEYAFDVESSATLTAEPADGYALSGWALSPGGLSCADEEPVCMVPVQTAGPVAATATFTAATAMLAVSVAGPGAAGGSVAVDFADGSPQGAASHGDAFSTPTAVTELAGTTLTATADPGYAFSGWAPAGGLSCEAGTDDNVCVLEVDLAAAAAGSPSAEAAFGLVATTLTVSAGANGSVAAIVRGAAADPVGAGASEEYAFDVESSATLTAEPADGYALSGWALSPGGLSCADEEPVCMVPVQTAGPVAATATFTAATAMLAVSVAGPGAAGGSVAVDFADGSPQGAASHGDAFSTPTAVTELAGTTLTATADPGYAFSGWAPAGGLSCEAGTDDNVCVLEVDLAAAAAGSPSAEAAFGLVATTLTVSAGDGGRVTAIVRGAAADPVGAGASEEYAFDVESSATLTAEPADGYALSGWALSPGGLSCADEEPVCMVPVQTAGPVAATATFTAATAMLAVSVAGPGAAGGSVAVDFADGSPQGAASHGDAFSTPTAVTELAGTTLTATADPGYAFSGWAPAGGLSCEAGTDDNVCVLEVDLAAAAAGSPSAEAAFGLVATTLTVSAGANGGRVTAIVRGAAADPVGAGASEEYAFDVESSATLTAEPADGYALSGWALSPGGLSCADEEPVCMVPVQTAGPVAATATFTAATAMLAVSVAGPGAAGGSVAVDFADGSPQGAASHGDAFSTPTAVTELAGTTLTATADPGYAFSGWAPAGGLSCEAGTDDNVCVLEVDLAAAAAGSPSAEAAFGLVATTLTVSAGANGSVAAIVRGADQRTRSAPARPSEYAFDVESSATLTAEPADGYALSAGRCRRAGCRARTKSPPAGPVAATAEAAAARPCWRSASPAPGRPAARWRSTSPTAPRSSRRHGAGRDHARLTVCRGRQRAGGRPGRRRRHHADAAG